MSTNRKLIPIGALITIGTITLASTQEGEGLPNTREVVGFLIVFTTLSAMQDLGAPIAGGLAMLVMVAILLARGPQALAFTVSKLDEQNRKRKGRKDG